MTKILLWVAAGGALGSIARFLLSKWATTAYSTHFPIGTFLVNIIGCFTIGIIWAFSLKPGTLSENYQLFLITGICGGFTTFSAFSLESIILLKEGKTALFLAYAFGSLILGFAATFVAYKLVRF